MLKEAFTIGDEDGSFLKVEQAKDGVDITLKTTAEWENYYIEHMTLTPDSVRALINALEESLI